MAVEKRVNDLLDEVDCLHDSLLQGIEILLTASLQDAASLRSTPTLVAVDDGALIGALEVLGDDLTVEASRTPVVRDCRWRPAMPVDEDYVMEGHKMSLAPHAGDYRLLTAVGSTRLRIAAVSVATIASSSSHWGDARLQGACALESDASNRWL